MALATLPGNFSVCSGRGGRAGSPELYLYHSEVTTEEIVVTNRTQKKEKEKERILNVSKSSWPPRIEVKWNVDVYNRPVTTKLTPHIFWPKVS